MNTSLYILAGEYKAIADKLMDSDLPPEVIADTLDGISGELETKATNVACFIRNLEASAEAIKEAEKHMAERRKAIESKSDHIRQYLKENMQRCGISKIESPYFALTIKKNPPAVIIDDASQIPDNYYVHPEPPEPYPDKKLIAQAIKDGYEIAGARLVQGERLEIK